MDVPFVSSGASSRLHYTLVRQVENAPSSKEAEAALQAQVEAIRKQLSTSAVSTVWSYWYRFRAQYNVGLNISFQSTCKELLIILLSCANASMNGTVTISALHFALPYAVNLSEAGKRISERRIGISCLALPYPSQRVYTLVGGRIYVLSGSDATGPRVAAHARQYDLQGAFHRHRSETRA